MHIVITSFGVRGDIQPYLALAVGLQRAGHQVTLATSSDFTAWIEAYGVAAHPTPHSMFALMRQPETRAVMTGRNPLRQMRLLRDTMRQVAASGDVLWAAMQAADFVIQSPTSTGALEAAHTRGIPAALAAPVPFAATRAFPSFFVGAQRWSLGSGYNRLTHALTHRLLWSLMGGPLTNPLRRKLGLKPWRSFAAVMAEARRLEVPMLYGFSAHVLPRPADWDAAQHITGYWFLDPSPAWQPPPDLLRFLDSGPPPIYVGFGSMGDLAPAGVTQKVLAALQKAGQRGVLLAGRGGPPGGGAAGRPPAPAGGRAAGQRVLCKGCAARLAVSADGGGGPPWRRGHHSRRLAGGRAEPRAAVGRGPARLGGAGDGAGGRTAPGEPDPNDAAWTGAGH